MHAVYNTVVPADIVNITTPTANKIKKHDSKLHVVNNNNNTNSDQLNQIQK